MGLFTKKDSSAEYQKNKKAYLDRISVQKNKNENTCLRLYKTVQEGKIARLYIQVTQGRLQVGDLLDIEYALGNKLGLHNVVGEVQSIHQILSAGGFGKKEELRETNEAYEKDMVWIGVPDVDVKMIAKNGMIRKSKTKNIVAEDAQSISMSVSYDEEVSQMVNYFKDELYGYFTEGRTIGHVTQDLGYSLMAQKKRLDRLGITMTIEKSSDIGSVATGMEVRRYSSSQYDVAEADEPVKLKRTYRRSDRIVCRDEDWRICHYLLAGAKFNNSGHISCPNCGNFAPREELLTGCPYCNTQFTIRDLSLRVAGYSQKKIEQSQMQKLQGKIDVGYALYHEGKQKEYDQILKHRMAQIDPLFSPTAFYNSMRNKLYSIAFAENAPALQNLADVDFDTAPFYPQFENVIDIDIQSIETRNFKRSDPYILIDVVMNTMILRYQASEGNALWTKEKITMSFVKHIANKTRNIFEPSKIQCPCCGGSYSLYDGKACTYCGNEIDYLMYDWLLVDLSVER